MSEEGTSSHVLYIEDHDRFDGDDVYMKDWTRGGASSSSLLRRPSNWERTRCWNESGDEHE